MGKHSAAKSEKFHTALAQYFANMQKMYETGEAELTPDRETAYRALKLNYDEMKNLEWISKLYANFKMNKSSLLILPNTGGSTSIMALYWVYITTENEIQIKAGKQDETIQKFVKLLDDYRIKLVTEVSELSDYDSFDLMVVYGSDKTCKKIAQRRDPLKRTVYYGSMTSIAVINDVEEVNVESLAADIYTYDGLGCLSPSIVYTPEPEKLAQLMQEYGSGNFSLERLMFMNDHKDKIHYNAIVREPFDYPVSGIGNNTIVFVRSGSNGQVDNREIEDEISLSRLEGKISSLTIDKGQVPDVGATRIARVGRAQLPSLRWKHDGRDSLYALVDQIGSEL